MIKSNMFKIIFFDLIFFVFIVLIKIWINFNNYSRDSIFDQKIIQAKIGKKIFKLEVATSSADQKQGLSDRPSLDPDQGMIFIFNRPGHYYFWMNRMKFPLDFVWIFDNKVVGLNLNVPPPCSRIKLSRDCLKRLKLFTNKKAFNRVIELNAGSIQTAGIKINDQIDFRQN
ncbi:DUF192 domain-containing protein [Patescibacteria group bacterium]|nr:DUF192 domain-containing protein [Patescibacteria group bacterium]